MGQIIARHSPLIPRYEYPTAIYRCRRDHLKESKLRHLEDDSSISKPYCSGSLGGDWCHTYGSSLGMCSIDGVILELPDPSEASGYAKKGTDIEIEEAKAGGRGNIETEWH